MARPKIAVVGSGAAAFGVLNALFDAHADYDVTLFDIAEPIASAIDHRDDAAAMSKDEVVGYLSDPFGEVDVDVQVPHAGLVIGRTNLPVVNQGDALFHVARVQNLPGAEDRLEAIEDEIEGHPLFDDDEII